MATGYWMLMPPQNVRHQSSQVVLFIDLLNHFESPDGRQLLKQSMPVADRLVKLKRRARRAKVPVVYVNDNFGQWRSDAKKILEYCVREKPSEGSLCKRSRLMTRTTSS